MDQWLETKQLPVHFVSAAGVVFKDGKVLLIRSGKRDEDRATIDEEEFS